MNRIRFVVGFIASIVAVMFGIVLLVSSIPDYRHTYNCFGRCRHDYLLVCIESLVLI